MDLTQKKLTKSEWESIGAKITVKVFEYGDLSQNIIKTRKYDALLFGEFVGKDLDLYAFWHSSQRNDPGQNIADLRASRRHAGAPSRMPIRYPLLRLFLGHCHHRCAG